jgi:hypothetical protein
MKKWTWGLLTIALLTACTPPSMSNVYIRPDYTMNYDSFVELSDGSLVDYYWPTIYIENTSNSRAYIVFKYSFYVCDVRLTDSTLNKTVGIYIPQGGREWEVTEKKSLVIDSSATCNNHLIDVEDIEFRTQITQVQKG